MLFSWELYELMREAGYTFNNIAKVLGTSCTTLWRRLNENYVSVSRFSSISNQALHFIVQKYQERSPNCGQVLLRGYLTSIGINIQQWRIRDSISRNDPLRQNIRRWRQQVEVCNTRWIRLFF